jgi:hypothetical protein
LKKCEKGIARIHPTGKEARHDRISGALSAWMVKAGTPANSKKEYSYPNQ